MDILTVEQPLVCTRRVASLKQVSLRVLRDGLGRRHVAVDPVGARQGDWVFTVSGSAARYATGDFGVLTDLTIGGIIDHWRARQRDGRVSEPDSSNPVSRRRRHG